MVSLVHRDLHLAGGHRWPQQFWIALGFFSFGALAFFFIGLAARQLALYLCDRYFERIEGHPPPDVAKTQFFVAVGGVMVLLAFLVALAV